MSDYIPEEIQFQILKLLPVKTLLRFRCVSKWWKQYIDSPSFLQHHLALQNPQFMLHITRPFAVLDPRTFPLTDTLTGPIGNPSRLVPLGGLHGVVCFYDTEMDLFSLWNPSLRKYSSIPRSNIDHLYNNDGAGVFYSGFWIDTFTKHFKFITFMLPDAYEEAVKANLYSSIEQEWKVLCLEGAQYCDPIEEHPSVVIGEVAYWRAYCWSAANEGDVVLLSFDFSRDTFDIIDAPPTKSRDWLHNPVLCNWKGALSLVYVNQKKRCDIYLRQQGSWVNLFSFNLPSDVMFVLWAVVELDAVAVEEMQESTRILAKAGDEDELELVLCETRDGSVPVRSGIDAYDDDPTIVYDFVESLVFPDLLNTTTIT